MDGEKIKKFFYDDIDKGKMWIRLIDSSFTNQDLEKTKELTDKFKDFLNNMRC